MSIETTLRSALDEIAGTAEPVPGLAASALRRARRRRTAMRSALAAGAVAAVAVPAGVAVLARDDDAATVASGGGTDILPAPEVRELTDEELAAADVLCDAMTDPVVMEPVRGFGLVDPVSDTASATWVVRESGRGTAVLSGLDCVLTGAGEAADPVWPGGGRVDGPGGPMLAGTVAGTGLYLDPVVRVTVQKGDGPEHDAVLADGYWMYPMDLSRGPSTGCSGFGDAGVIGSVTGPEYTVRGYDADGRVVSDSSAPGAALCTP